MRDYKKIYDELFNIIKAAEKEFISERKEYITHLMYEEDYSEWLFGKYTEDDKRRKAELTTLIYNLYEDTPTQEVINLFNYIFSNINTVGEWVQISIDSGYWEDVFESYKTPDEQIEAVCKKHAYLEWWARTIYCLLLCEHKGKPIAPIYQVYFDERFIDDIINLFDYYHKSIVPKKALSELCNTPNKEQETQDQEPQTPTNPILPSELSTPEAMRYFNLAVEKGYMKMYNNKYYWINTGKGTTAKLAYFLSFVYQKPRPINALETYFNVKKLSSAITQSEYEPKRIDVITWRNQMKKDLDFNNFKKTF